MRTQRIYLLSAVLLFFLQLQLQAQEVKVKSFERLDRDLTARTQERLDLNDEPCAIVRVSIPNAKAYQFEGNIVGDVIYNPGEALVYVVHGSRNLTITSDKFGSLSYEFPEAVVKQVVYKLVLKFEESGVNKLRTLIAPVAGVGANFSPGIMLGVVKKTGWYFKAKYDFKSVTSDIECDKEGNTAEGNPLWLTGQKESNRLALTTGLMLRLGKSFYLYGGGGYGYRKMTWETADALWAECTDQSYTGAEADLGCILRAKSVAFIAGVQTNSFKYYEATLGIGFLF